MAMKGKKNKADVKKDSAKTESLAAVIVKIPGPDGVEVEKKLTIKEENFCQAYLIDFNGAKAARAAGYSELTAYAIAAENLRKPHIRIRIQQLRDEMAVGFNITRERIALEYSRLAFFDPRKMYDQDGNIKPVNQWGDDEAVAIAGVEMETEKPKNAVVDIDDNGDMVDSTGDCITVVTKIRHASKRDALDSLVKLMGYAAPTKTEIAGPGGKDLGIPVINLNVVQPKTDEDE